MNFVYRICFLLFCASALCSSGSLESARSRLDSIVASSRGVIGVAVIDCETGDTLTIHGSVHFPMQSVFKFPLALAVLHRVDQGRDSLKELVRIRRSDLPRNTWSPLRDAYPSGDLRFPLDTLLWYTVALSDNNACDILFKLCGGPDSVQSYIRSLGINDISIVATEAGMRVSWDVQYRNWSTPMAMARLLKLYLNDSIIAPGSFKFLWETMLSTATGTGRIRALLPPGTLVAHKTGSSGTNGKKVAAATNDAGIIVCPGGRRIALAVFVSDSDAPEGARDHVIASIAKGVWDAVVSR
jgi:beta-lactamase class A